MQEIRSATARALIWPGIHAETGENARVLVPGARRAFVVTDHGCLEIARRVAMSLQQGGYTVAGGAAPSGKGPAKSATLQTLQSRAAKFGKEPFVVVAVGGSALLHLGARLAGSGPWIAVPASLRAQLDACVGGASCPQPGTGWRPPAAAFIDPTLPSSLNLREYLAGLAEPVRCGVVQDPDLLDFLEARAEAVRGRNPTTLEELAYRTLKVKAAAVDSPSPGPGARATLRYGHFAAGAIERLAGTAILHGEALAVGMEAEMKISRSLGWAGEAIETQQNRVLKVLGLPTRAKGLPADRLAAPLLAGRLPTLDLPDEAGHSKGPAAITPALVSAAFAAVTK